MNFKYGRIEIRAKIPTATGAWPAIWTLGQNWEWPSNGEIDILEYYISGGVPSILANFAWGSATRWQAQWSSWAKPFSYFLAKDPDWANKYHRWVMEWDAEKTYIYLDDEVLRNVNSGSFINGGYDNNREKPFQQPHYVILNLAIGSNGGTPNVAAFPLKYEVDYVRIYQRK